MASLHSLAKSCVRSNPVAAFLLFIGTASMGLSQVPLDINLRLHNSDAAVLESDESRNELPCRVSPEKPALRYDLRLYVDYKISVPLKNLEPRGEKLDVLLRVTPLADTNSVVYMSNRFLVPPIPDDAKGEGIFDEGFAVGPGRYRVDWLMRDARGRYCSSHWQTEAKLATGEKNLPMGLQPNVVLPRPDELYTRQRVSDAKGPNPMHVKVLLNVTPGNAGRVLLDSGETEVLESLLQNLGREPRFSSFRLVAFNHRSQRVIHRQEDVRQIDIGALQSALAKSGAGTINYRSLQDPHGESKFIAGILAGEIAADAAQPDVVIVAGPKTSVDGKVPLEQLLRDRAEVNCPIFYFSYVADPMREPFRDSIGAALKAYKTTSQYTITRPRDMEIAISHLLSWVTAHDSSGTD
jgi:hypothetical protein